MQQPLPDLRAELLRTRAHRFVGLATCVITMLSARVTLGHGPAPAPLGVLRYDASSERATLVRTSIGLARDHAPLGWTYVCPSQYGDREQARAAHSASSGITLMVGGGVIYRATEGVCAFEALSSEVSVYALDLETIGDAIWLIALREGEQGRLILRADAEGPAAVVADFQGDTPLRIDSLAGYGPWGLLALASSPEPTLVLGLGDLSDPQSLAWSTRSIGALPQSTSHLDVRHEGDDGEVWFVTASEDGRALWRGAPPTQPMEGPSQWTQVGASATTLLGPVRVNDTWVVVRDGRLEREWEGSWEDLGAVDTTALMERDGVIFAMTLTEVHRVDGVGPDGVRGPSVFQMAKLLAPLEGCPPTASGQDACINDWVHFGAEVGLLDPEQLTTEPLEEASPLAHSLTESPGTEGCQGASPSLPWALLMSVSLLFSVGRARRRIS